MEPVSVIRQIDCSQQPAGISMAIYVPVQLHLTGAKTAPCSPLSRPGGLEPHASPYRRATHGCRQSRQGVKVPRSPTLIQ